MPAGPEKGKGWPIYNTYSSYINCSFSSNRLDILGLEYLFRASTRVPS